MSDLITVLETGVVITLPPAPTVREIITPEPISQTVVLQGQAGPQGPASAPDANYVHTQSLASSVWTIQHNLGKMPSVEVMDSGFNVVYGDINYVNNNTVQLTFLAPFGGKATLN